MPSVWSKSTQKVRAAFARALVPELRAIGVDDPRMMEIFGIKPSASGMQVNERTALTVSAVYGCVTLLADCVGKIPLKLYKKTDSGREEIDDDSRSALFAHSPNGHQTAFEFRRLMQGAVGLRGNAYARIYRDPFNEVTRIDPLCPSKVQLYCVEIAPGEYETRYLIDGEKRLFTRADILHIPCFGVSGSIGLSPIRLLADSVGNSLAYREQAGKMMANGAKFPGFLSTPNTLSKEQMTLMSEEWRKNQGGTENAGKTPILFGGIKFETVGMTAEDAQLLQSRSFEVEEIARAYRVPLHLLQSTQKSTTWGSGIEQQDRAFLNLSLDPHLICWEQACNLSLLTEKERRKGYYFKFNRNAIIQIAAKDFAEIARINRDMAVWSVNDVRERLDMNHLDGDMGDDYLLPFNGSGGAAVGTKPTPASATDTPAK